ncbi:fibronectin type III domain-containing protein [Kitasatospora sp. NPDC048239]|uniref:fibronectin type III domain-containing protein n=1 Tax=Kitasatospora sp. NPDC048239 TaxID=3364046 RepID=UPI003721FCAD
MRLRWIGAPVAAALLAGLPAPPAFGLMPLAGGGPAKASAPARAGAPTAPDDDSPTEPRRPVTTLPAPKPPVPTAAAADPSGAAEGAQADGPAGRSPAAKDGTHGAAAAAQRPAGAPRRPDGLVILEPEPVKTDDRGRLTGPAALVEPPAPPAPTVAAAAPADAPKADAPKADVPKAAELAKAPAEEQSAAAASAPGVPTGISAIARDGGARISWTPPASDGGSPITGYTVAASPGGAGVTAPAGATSVSLYYLTNGTPYTFTVAAANATGSSAASAASAPVTPKAATQPSGVGNLQVAPGNARATVTWTLPASDGGADLTGQILQVYRASDRSFVGSGSLSATATSASIGNLPVGTAFYVTLYAKNRSNYVGPIVTSADFTPVAGPQPAPPASVLASPGTGAATVTWTPPVQDGGSPVTGYTVRTYDAASNAVGSPVTVGASARSATISGLTNGSSYFFGISAANASGAGPAWYTALVTPAAAPGAPGGIVSHPANKAAFIEWAPPPTDGGSPITSYTATLTGSDGSTVNKQVGSASALFSGLDNGVSYTVSVKAANAVTSGPVSASAQAGALSSKATRPVGDVKHSPKTAGPPVGGPFVEQRYAAKLSGNGRFLFYYAELAAGNSAVQSGWYRYDMQTGATIPVWNYASASEIPLQLFAEHPESVSFDGKVFSGFGGEQLYVWYADTGEVVRASNNAAGGPTAGRVHAGTLSGDGRFLTFVVEGSSDMASHGDGCGVGRNYSGGPTEPVDVYRFDTSIRYLSRIQISFTNENAFIDCVLPDETNAKPAVTADGGRLLLRIDFVYHNAGGSTLRRFNQAVVTDIPVVGPAASTWIPLQEGYSFGIKEPVYLSDDGRTGIGQLQSATGQAFVRFDPDTPTAAPAAFAGGDSAWDYTVSRDGRTLVALVGRGSSDGHQTQTAVIDTVSGQLTVASQINGELSNAGMDAGYNSADVDGTGRKVAIVSMAPNMLGRTDCEPVTDTNAGRRCTPDVSLVDLATGAVGVLPTQTLGCVCRTSRVPTSALQSFVGDPVNTATGSYTESVQDGVLQGEGLQFDLRRSYNSAAAGVAGPFGPGWSAPYGMSLTPTAATVTLTDEGGAAAVYTKQPDGSYRAPAGVRSALAAKSGGGYTLTTPDGQVDTFDQNGRLTAMTDRDGRGLTLGYTGAQLTGVTDSGGRTVGFDRDPSSGQISKLTMPDGRTTSYGYDTAKRLTTVTTADGATTYGYDPGGRLTTVTDPAGHLLVTNTYDPATGRVVAQAQNGGSRLTLAWDAASGTATAKDAENHTTTDYYADNVLVSHVDAVGGRTSYTYDDRLNLTSVTDPNGNTARMSYDEAGNLVSRTLPGSPSGTESWTYDTRHNPLTQTDALGNTTTFTYDTANHLRSALTPGGSRTEFGYTSGGLVETVTRNGHTTTNGYDQAGNLVSTTDPTGGRTTFGYDGAGRLLTRTDPRGNAPGARAADYTTGFEYDGVGRVAKQTDPLGRATRNGYDPAGNLTTVTDPAGKIVHYAYDDLGRQTGRTDANGHTTTTSYTPAGRVGSVTDAAGARTTFTYDAEGRLLTTTDPRGNAAGATAADYTTTRRYDAAGNPIAVTDPLGNTTKTAYDAANRPVSVTDPLGHTTVTGYDQAGRPVSVTGPTGAVTRSTYDKDGRLTAATDPLGNTTRYAYDPDGHPVLRTTPLGAKTSWTYDAAGRQLTETDPRGNTPGADPAAFTTVRAYDVSGLPYSVTDPLGGKTGYRYDGAGQLTAVVDPLGNTTGYGYDLAGRQNTVTDPNGKVRTTGFDAAGRAVETVDELGNRTGYSYDAADRPASVTTPRGNAAGAQPSAYTTRYGYDPVGNRTSVTDPLGGVTRTAYDAVNRPVSVTDQLGHATATEYDKAGQVVKVTDPTGAVVRSGYDPAGRLTGSTDPLGNVTTFGYDAAGHQQRRVSPLGATLTRGYDADGRVVSSTSPRGNANGANPADFTTRYGYDPAGNQTSVTDPLGHATTVGYDALNRRITATDPLGRLTGYTYDKAGRITGVTDPTGAATGYGYDTTGNLTTRQDPNGHTTGYTYDDAHQLLGVLDPLSRTTAYGYDPDGNRITTTNARHTVSTATVDARGLTTRLSHSDATPEVSYTYDPAGRRTGITDATGSRTLTYDDAGRLLTSTVGGGISGSFGYVYDKAGRVTGRTYPDGATTAFGYDSDGRRTSQTVGSATTAYGYDADGNLTGTTLPAAVGRSENRGYDPVGRLTSASTSRAGAVTSSWTVTRDAAGRTVGLDTVTAGSPQPQQTYGYDNADRLTSWCTAPAAGTAGCPDGSSQVAYGYDKVGNRTSLTRAGRTTTYTYDAADQLTLSASGLVRQNYTYDADGNYTGNGSSANTIAYDAGNRPISAVQAGVAFTFTNDDQGNRVTTRVAGAVSRTAVWDANNPLPELATQTDGSGALLGDYRTDPLGRPQSTHTPAGDSYELHDQLGSVAEVAGADGTALARYGYDPFGVQTTAAPGTPAAGEAFGFTGELNDPVLTGKQDLRARSYDPVTGRFTGRDPIGLRPAEAYTSDYAYAANRPTDLTDPSGLAPEPTPGNGWWDGGGGEQHDFVLQMAYEQEVALHGVENVYADLAGTPRSAWGNQLMNYPTYWSDYAEPDLVAAGVLTPRGRGFALWDVKPASAYGRSLTASVNKLAGYIRGFSQMSGWPAMAGDPIVPEMRPYPRDRRGAEGLMLMFNGANWSTFGAPEPKANGLYPDADIAPVGDTSGLIYYRLLRHSRNQGWSERLAALQALSAQGAQAGTSVTVCQPTGVATAVHEPLRTIGQATGADISSVASLTALTAFPAGPIDVIDPNPLYMPPAPEPVRVSHGYGSSGSYHGGSDDFDFVGPIRDALHGLAWDLILAGAGSVRLVGRGAKVVGQELFGLAA